MKAKIRILFLTYTINISHKWGNFYRNLLVKNLDYGQNCGQLILLQA